MFLLILYSFISINIFSNINCDSVPTCINYKVNNYYIYNKTISITRWPKIDKTKVNRINDSFKLVKLPLSLNNGEYEMKEIILGSQNSFAPYILGHYPNFFPKIYTKSMCINGVVVDKKKSSVPNVIKTAKCNEILKTSQEVLSSDGRIKLSKKVISKLTNLENIKVKNKKVKVIKIIAKKEVKISGEMKGTGIENTKLTLEAKTRIPLKEETNFRYSYKKGREENAFTEIMIGKVSKDLLKKKTLKLPKTRISLASNKKFQTRFYTNKKGLFIPIRLNEKLKTKAFLDLTSNFSYLDYIFFKKNIDFASKNLFKPFKAISFGKNTIYNPYFEITNIDEDLSSYSIPCIIGKNLLQDVSLYLNEKNRSFSIYASGKSSKKPKNAIPFKLINGIPVFTVKINTTPVKATFGFTNFKNVISKELKNNLNIESIELSKKVDSKVITQTKDLLLDPPDRSYYKTTAIVKDFQKAPYDFKLGLDYIKRKEIIIDYKNKWFLIK
jgi:hypothetical protein